MGKYLEVKNEIDKIKLKYDRHAKKDRTKLGITSVEEHKRMLEKEMEIISGKTFDEILAGTSEEFNKILNEVERRSYLLDLMKEGVNYKIYENLYLKSYLNDDGSINHDKVKLRLNEPVVKKELSEVKKGMKLKILNRNHKGKKNKEFNSIERSDLLEYFPYISKIEQVEDSKMIFMEYDHVELESLSSDLTSTLNIKYPTFDAKLSSQSDNAKKIIEFAEMYRKKCGKPQLDAVEFAKWAYEDIKQFRNYSYAYNHVSLGSQDYINYHIDLIEDEKVKKHLMELTFTTVITTVNPIGPNVVATTAYSSNCEYSNKRQEKLIYPLRYADEEIAQNLIENGLPIDVYDIDDEVKLIGKYNQD